MGFENFTPGKNTLQSGEKLVFDNGKSTIVARDGTPRAEKNLSRRAFLKKATLGAVGVAGAMQTSEVVRQILTTPESSSENTVSTPEKITSSVEGEGREGADEVRIDQMLQQQSSREQLKESFEHLPNSDVLVWIDRIMESPPGGETPETQLAHGADKITLDGATERAILEHWHRRYSDPEDLGKDLDDALARIELWDDEMAFQFARKGMPPCLRYLTIPESHFNIAAINKGSGAGGSYQIMEAMAPRLNVLKRDGYDERRDPITSTQGARDLMYEAFEKLDDWPTVFSDYNGVYTKHFAAAHGNRVPHDFEEFNMWRETKINEHIAQQYASLTPEQRADRLDKSKYSENVDYPMKFFAVLQVLEQRGLIDRDETVMHTPELPYDYVNVSELVNTVRLQYTVVKKDNPQKIARRLKKELEGKEMHLRFVPSVPVIAGMLQIQNDITDPTKLMIGQKLKWEYNFHNNHFSLNDVIEKLPAEINRALSRDVVTALNPAATNSDKKLPAKCYIRLPKKESSTEQLLAQL